VALVNLKYKVVDILYSLVNSFLKINHESQSPYVASDRGENANATEHQNYDKTSFVKGNAVVVTVPDRRCSSRHKVPTIDISCIPFVGVSYVNSCPPSLCFVVFELTYIDPATSEEME
jgi:hypothetical protein